jgi:PiT family inorganic phosphate transporter
MSYLISIWLLNASKKTITPKVVTLAIMGITIWFVESQMKYYDAIEKPRFDSHFWSVAFESHNLKWFLVAFIILAIISFCLIFSSLNLNQATAWLKKMQLLSSAAFSLGHGGNDSQKVMVLLPQQLRSIFILQDQLRIVCLTG